MKKITGVILAAGKGTRLNNGIPSDIPKVLHLLHGRPLILHCIDSFKKADIEDIILVVGHKGFLVKQAIGNGFKYAVQDKQLGTAHAVLVAKDFIPQDTEYIIVLNGDNPLFKDKTISQLINQCIEKEATISLVTAEVSNPAGLGRIIKDKDGHVLKIIEEKETSLKEKKIKEINAGCYCFKNDWLWENIDKVKLSPHNEYYLTDLVSIAVKKGEKVTALKVKNSKEAIGINTPKHLEDAHKAYKKLL